MEMGASNTEAQVSATMAGVIWFVVMIHDFWTIIEWSILEGGCGVVMVFGFSCTKSDG